MISLRNTVLQNKKEIDNSIEEELGSKVIKRVDEKIVSVLSAKVNEKVDEKIGENIRNEVNRVIKDLPKDIEGHTKQIDELKAK